MNVKELSGKDVLEMSHVACIAGQSGPEGKERERADPRNWSYPPFIFSNINVSRLTSELGGCCVTNVIGEEGAELTGVFKARYHSASMA